MHLCYASNLFLREVDCFISPPPLRGAAGRSTASSRPPGGGTATSEHIIYIYIYVQSRSSREVVGNVPHAHRRFLAGSLQASRMIINDDVGFNDYAKPS